MLALACKLQVVRNHATPRTRTHLICVAHVNASSAYVQIPLLFRSFGRPDNLYFSFVIHSIHSDKKKTFPHSHPCMYGNLVSLLVKRNGMKTLVLQAKNWRWGRGGEGGGREGGRITFPLSPSLLSNLSHVHSSVPYITFCL